MSLVKTYIVKFKISINNIDTMRKKQGQRHIMAQTAHKSGTSIAAEDLNISKK